MPGGFYIRGLPGACIGEDAALSDVAMRAVSAFRELPSPRAALTGALTLCYTEIGGRRVAAEVARATVSDVTSGVK